MMKKKAIISLLISILVPLVALCVPLESYHIVGLSIVERRIIALFIFAALMWISEAIPVWATSVLVIVIMLLSVSNSSFLFLRDTTNAENFGHLIKNETIIAAFADPIIMLFLGGFILAIAAEKCGLDKTLARALFRPFGKKSNNVLLGLLFVTAVFSMFMSNTATTAMIFAVLYPVLRTIKDDAGKIALVLAIPIAANIGGIGTPIGTPPNAIALKYLNDPDGLNMGIGFGQWMLVMVPFVCVIIFLSWLMLKKLYPFKEKFLEISLEGKFEKSTRSYIVCATFFLTVLLWMFDKFTGVNSNVVAMIPVAVFCATGVIDRGDLKRINWDVLWLVAGGFALGVGLNDSGLASHLMTSIPFAEWSPAITILGAGLLCYALSTFISNTATTALLVPILAAAAKGMSGSQNSLDTVCVMLIGVALSASFAMALPVSTPPNAIAYSEGIVSQKQMATVGLLVGAIGFVLGYVWLFFLGIVHYF